MEDGAGAAAPGGQQWAAANNNQPPQQQWDEDLISWEDSERFEEDSLCSWMSEPESLNQNWRGWSARTATAAPSDVPGLSSTLNYTGGIHLSPSAASATAAVGFISSRSNGGVPRLLELSARLVACTKSAEEIDLFSNSQTNRLNNVRDEVMKKVAYYCFPSTEDDVRLYCCLANGNADEFQRGQSLYEAGAVKQVLQIGFHLSAQVSSGGATLNSVAMSLDRCRITTCNCTCNPTVTWCAHAVAVCLYRLRRADAVRYSLLLSDSLNLLRRSSTNADHRCEGSDRLIKFASFLLAELPRQYLPTAQALLDQLLDDSSRLSVDAGAPDPTAGGALDEQPVWCLDTDALQENVRKILYKLCVPAPTVYSDVNYLSSSQPPAATEWQSLLRALRGREPEGLWNLLSIVDELYRRQDDNAVRLLHIITEQCLQCDRVVIYWYETKLAHSGYWVLGSSAGNSSNKNQNNAQYSCSSICDRVVELWRLAALNPRHTFAQRRQLACRLQAYHKRAVEKVWKILADGHRLSTDTARFDLQAFPGFRNAIQACFVRCWPTVNGTEASVLDSAVKSATTGIETLSVECAPLSSSNNSKPPALFSPSLTVLREKPSKLACLEMSPQMIMEEEEKVDMVAMDKPVAACCTATARSSSSSEGNTTEPSEPPDNIEKIYMAAPPHQHHPSSSTRANGNLGATGGASASGACPKRKPPFDELLACLNSLEDGAREASAVANGRLDAQFLGCEALYGHGMGAVQVATRLAQRLMVVNPPNLLAPVPPPLAANTPNGHSGASSKGGMSSGGGGGGSSSRKKKKSGWGEPAFLPHPKAVEMSALASETLRKARFLFEVLCKQQPKLAFTVGLWALELPRQPAATRFLEVEMHWQESEIVAMLRQLTLGPDEIRCLRERALKFKSGVYASGQWQAVLPFSLAHYVSDCVWRLDDAQLGFDAALAALSMKSSASEHEHPMLCESIRRQRGDLALSLLLRYKDHQDKLAQVMDRLLDPVYRQPNTADAAAAPLQRSFSGVSQQSSVPDDSDAAGDDRSDSPGRHSNSRRSTDEGNGSRSDSGENSPKPLLLPSLFNAAAAVSATAVESRLPEPISTVTYFKTFRNRKQALYVAEASEAHAHYMTELAKRLLHQAGGNQSTSIFNAHPHQQPVAGAAGAVGGQPSPHRGLHLCAFQIGLYALGLHNRLAPNWLSRTYSTHVSWISGQAIEIGRTAIKILIDTWENHLTPTEVANLADKASQGREPGMVQVAAELALSVLSKANALNPTEIQRALAQCREQNQQMLEKACIDIEKAAQDGGVHPEVLFMVARRWGELYTEFGNANNAAAVDGTNAYGAQRPASHHARQQQRHSPPSAASSSASSLVGASSHHHHHHSSSSIGGYNTSMHPMISPGVNIEISPPNGLIYLMPPKVNTAPSPNAMPPAVTAFPLPPTSAPNHPPPMFYCHPPPAMRYQQPPPPSAAALHHHQQQAAAAAAVVAANNGGTGGITRGPPQINYYPLRGAANNAAAAAAAALHASHSAPNLNPLPHPSNITRHHNYAQPPPQSAQQQRVHAVPQLQHQSISAPPVEDYRQRYLSHAFRVGMLAMTTMARRLNDERSSYIKYSQNPPYGDDVRWLVGIAEKLGQSQTEELFRVCTQAVLSPFVLWDVAVEAARLFPAPGTLGGAPVVAGPLAPVPFVFPSGPSGGSSSPLNRLAAVFSVIAASGLATPATPLLHQCLKMFYAASAQKLSHPKFAPADTEEVCCLVRAAKRAYRQMPQGVQTRLLDDFHQNLRKQKACKRDVAHKISALFADPAN